MKSNEKTKTLTEQQRQAWDFHMSNRYRTNHKQPRTCKSSAQPKPQARKIKLVWRNIIKNPSSTRATRKNETAVCAEA